jgi:hypothetical protein
VIDGVVPGWTGQGKEPKEMKTYTINSENNITVHGSRKAAHDFAAAAGHISSLIVFTGQDNIATLEGMTGARLVEIYNSLTGVIPVKKFTSGAVASKRILAELAKLDVSVDATTADADLAPVETRNIFRLQEQAAKKKAGGAKKNATKGPKAAKTAGDGTSKKDQVLAMIGRNNGATLDEIMTVTGWQRHTVRGFIAILGKKGTKIESTRSEAGARTYKAA